MHAPRLALAAVTAILLLPVPAPGARAQQGAPELPFAAGESLRYRAVSSRIGTFGSGTLRVEGPETVRGQGALRLCFDFQGRVGPFRVRDQTRSWLVPDRMLSLRYQKSERSPLGSREESVEIFPAEQRWTSAGGPGGQPPTLTPLDELSFLYFIRTLPLEGNRVETLVRHFDPERNPVIVRVLRRERVVVPAGEFATVVVEMRVKDRRVFGGGGTLLVYLSDDDRRIPVRMDSSFPGVGPTRLLLESGP